MCEFVCLKEKRGMVEWWRKERGIWTLTGNKRTWIAWNRLQSERRDFEKVWWKDDRLCQWRMDSPAHGKTRHEKENASETWPVKCCVQCENCSTSGSVCFGKGAPLLFYWTEERGQCGGRWTVEIWFKCRFLPSSKVLLFLWIFWLDRVCWSERRALFWA